MSNTFFVISYISNNNLFFSHLITLLRLNLTISSDEQQYQIGEATDAGDIINSSLPLIITSVVLLETMSSFQSFEAEAEQIEITLEPSTAASVVASESFLNFLK